MQKTIYFDKYIPYTLSKAEDGTQIEKKLNLHPLFDAIQSGNPGESLQEIFGEKYRIQICKYHNTEKIWELQILHLRNAVLPGIADEKKEFKPLTLPAGHYPTECCTILYSSEDNLFYIQRNIICLSAKRFAFYLKKMLSEGTKVLLKPVIDGSRIHQITNTAVYRKVVLACTIDSKKPIDSSRRLGKLLHSYSDYQGVVANISIGMGRKKGRLNTNEVYELVKEAYEESDVQALKVQLDSTGIGTYEWLDLMLDRASYAIRLEYTNGDPILHHHLFNACLEKIQIEKQKA